MFNHDAELKRRLYAAYTDKGGDYRPRTRHLDEQNQAIYINRLILEDSPYLLQHAHNPVDWHPWGRESFTRAETENKPVFLSIGYSTCHWCHVMEAESFDDETIAGYMNEHFIPIKVDRELHPDIDAFYMLAVLMMGGQGGWPMSSFLTTEGKPFFGGTYYPPQQFMSLLQQIYAAWMEKPDDVLKQAGLVTNRIDLAMSTRRQAADVGNATIKKALEGIVQSFDQSFGGFGQAPKFPNEPCLFLLLEAEIHFNSASNLNVLNKTLQSMAQGGIYDHVGGGFHRYATDRHWLVPHFEKMLYNQANLARIYLRAYQLTGLGFYRQVVTETLDYILREMTDEQGGFYSATDADSEGREGAFFTWTCAQLKACLSQAEHTLAVGLFGATEGGNFEGENILFLAESYAEYADNNDLILADLLQTVAAIKQKLLSARNQRVPPLRDDKIITAWNGMMISAFSDAGKVLERKDYARAATEAANYLLHKHRGPDGSLFRASLRGHCNIAAAQEDYAFLAEALIQLYDDTNDARWLREAQAITDAMLAQFLSEQDGGFYMAAEESALPVRLKELDDNAVPSGNSVALRILAKMARRTGKEQYNDTARALISGFSEKINQYPHAFAYFQTGLLEFLHDEYGHRQYAAGGNVLIDAQINNQDPQMELNIAITIKSGWHINAGGSPDGGLTAMELSADADASWQISAIDYPAPVSGSLSFASEEIPLYKDRIAITVRLKRKGHAAPLKLIRLELRLQACNQDTCLAPETVPLIVSETSGRSHPQ